MLEETSLNFNLNFDNTVYLKQIMLLSGIHGDALWSVASILDRTMRNWTIPSGPVHLNKNLQQ
jgi:hypothetical protein